MAPKTPTDRIENLRNKMPTNKHDKLVETENVPNTIVIALVSAPILSRNSAENIIPIDEAVPKVRAWKVQIGISSDFSSKHKNLNDS